MTRTYELKDFRKNTDGVVVIFENGGNYSFILETRINGEYISISDYGFKTDEKALLSAFNRLESRSYDGIQHEAV